MNDHERFTKEMNVVFEVLENLIRALPVSMARQDELSMYAKQLKETAYQAGRTEAA